ncbi:Xaa-Pro peptidase family protein [Phaeovulum sp. NW3]|uniref:M24 family metallopeptidase n=1 Tax=Phaeovulum sp. NW3 TaxID=2934933 RepID=UPI0020205FD6|nr:Xaa-Pro peptidase family protein [Phaeovulum sp. NW3]MCL7465319.1 Xaa-Pro peptidase family protein [Phaeovulum sp. NW3]
MADLDRARASALMAAEGFEALILLSPESFRHATGAQPGVGTMWRRAGAVAVLVPADPSLPEMAVVSDLFVPAFRAASHITDIRPSPLWVEIAALPPGLDALPLDKALTQAWTAEGRGPDFLRPTTFDPATCWRHLAQALADRGLSQARIGVEMAAISAADLPALASALAPAQLVDGSALSARLKMVKTSAEIALLRQAVELAELGIAAIRDAIAPGISRNELSAIWSAAIAANKGDAPLTGAWDYLSVGPDPWGGNAVARPGDLVKVDVGCLMAGYTSDTGRTFVVGAPSAAAQRVHDALMAGFRAGMAVLGPGIPLSQVHRVTQDAIRAAGLPGFSRGHYGHGLGASLGSEEWPFIAADSDVIAEPGMVLAFECPFYVTGLGGFIIEDQVLITATGAEPMNRLPHDLIACG